MTQKSSMPPPEEIEALVLMNIMQLVVQDHPATLHKLTVEVGSGDTFNNAQALIYTIDDPVIKGYLPSRVWFAGEDETCMSFYVNQSLPKEARPLGDQGFCVFILDVPPRATVRYDIYTQLFIDQLNTPYGMKYVFVFAEKELPKLLFAEKE